MERLLAIVFAVMLATVGSKAQNAQISSVELKGNWYSVYNEKGQKVKSLYAGNTGELKGYSASFFICKKGSWYYLYDAKGNSYKTLYADNIGEIMGVAGDNFTARHGSWIYTFDRNGNRIATRYAQ